MPTFGICVSPDQSAAVKSAGWDFVEGNVQALFQGLLPDDQWTGEAAIRQSVLPVPAANVLVPGDLKITGPTADLEKLRAYMSRVLARAGKCGTKTLVFGSGVARTVTGTFDRGHARRQIMDFVRMSAEIARKHGVTIVIEPLNKSECNIVNSVAAAMEYVRGLDHPSFQCLVDSYHFWLEDEPLDNLSEAMPWIKHVHLADQHGRVAPGQSGKSDYAPFFKVLKAGGYDGRISVEVKEFVDAPASYGPVLAYVKKQWSEA